MLSPNDRIAEYVEVHAKPGGPTDARPTAMQILEDEGLLMLPNRLTNKTILVTGGTSGLGLEIAKALHVTGAKVFISGRCGEAKGTGIASSIGNTTADEKLHPVRFVPIDLSDLTSVKEGARIFLEQSKTQLNILICNAGIMAPRERQVTKQGHEMQFGVNYLAHFLLLQLLYRTLLASSEKDFPSRAVIVSSCAHRSSGLLPNDDYACQKMQYDPGITYGQSKTADIYLANGVEQRFGAQGLHGLSVHPGIIMETGITRHMADDHKELEKQIIDAMPEFKQWGKSAEQGAGCILWAAVATKLDGVGGLYLEDCNISQPVKEGAQWFEPGREKWCYDEAAAAKLWVDSEKLIESLL